MIQQRLEQKLVQKLSPQQIQLLKLLYLPVIQLEERIKEELEVNPALEEGSEDKDTFTTEEEASEVASYDEEPGEDENVESEEDNETQIHNTDGADDINLSYYYDDENENIDFYEPEAVHTPEDEKKPLPLVAKETFRQQLLEQLNAFDLNEKEIVIAHQIIGSLDDDGYLRRDLQAIEDDLAFSQNIYCSKEEVEKVLSFIQQLDPPGVGARNLQECLLIQLRRKPYKTHSTILASQIIEEHFDLFIKKHFDKLEKILGVSQEKFKDVLHEITHLNPKPSSAAETTDNNEHYIVPDFTVHNNNGELVVSLNRRNAPELRINQAFREMLQRLKKSKKLSRKDREAIHFIKQKIESAKWFIDAIQQRQNTMLAVMNAIVMLQHDFFLTGDVSSLKPMILKDIEEVTKLDVSTLSRITHNKFVETEFGTFPLRFFFSDALTTREGEEVSTHEVKNALKGIIEKENKASPYTDQDLTEILNEMGYKLTRRTVAKYREAMHIPVARLRKQTV